jgi:hypothetical protein
MRLRFSALRLLLTADGTCELVKESSPNLVASFDSRFPCLTKRVTYSSRLNALSSIVRYNIFCLCETTSFVKGSFCRKSRHNHRSHRHSPLVCLIQRLLYRDILVTRNGNFVGQVTHVTIGVIESSARLMNKSLRPATGSLSGDRR